MQCSGNPWVPLFAHGWEEAWVKNTERVPAVAGLFEETEKTYRRSESDAFWEDERVFLNPDLTLWYLPVERWHATMGVGNQWRRYAHS